MDTEDVAVKANELAPGRFTWRKYPEQINLELIRVYLSDAKKPEKGAYVLGSGRDGWLLSEAGLRFAVSHAEEARDADLMRPAMTPKARRWAARERVRMLGSVAYAKWIAGAPESISHKEAEDFFRVDDYVAGVARERRLTRIVNSFGDDPDLGGLIHDLAAQVRAE